MKKYVVGAVLILVIGIGSFWFWKSSVSKRMTFTSSQSYLIQYPKNYSLEGDFSSKNGASFPIIYTTINSKQNSTHDPNNADLEIEVIATDTIASNKMKGVDIGCYPDLPDPRISNIATSTINSLPFYTYVFTSDDTNISKKVFSTIHNGSCFSISLKSDPEGIIPEEWANIVESFRFTN